MEQLGTGLHGHLFGTPSSINLLETFWLHPSAGPVFHISIQRALFQSYFAC